MAKPIHGVLPIVHTPYQEDGSIDETTYRREIDWLFEVGADGFGFAMVSEVLRLTRDERFHLSHKLVEWNRNRGAVILSVGAETVEQTLAYAKVAQEAGCDAIMAIPPQTPCDLDAFFGRLADTADVPLIVQDASSYVGDPITVEFMASLLRKYGAEKILFKPEASPVGPLLSQLRDATDGQARIFDGSGGILLVDTYRRGITGTMPGTDLLDAIVPLWQALENGREEDIYRLSFPVSALVALQMQAGLDGFLHIEKYILKSKGLFPSDRVRDPSTWTLDDETRREVDRLLEKLNHAIANGHH